MIAERFNTYRFADYKEKVIDLLAGDDAECGNDGGGEGDGEGGTLGPQLHHQRTDGTSKARALSPGADPGLMHLCLCPAGALGHFAGHVE